MNWIVFAVATGVLLGVGIVVWRFFDAYNGTTGTKWQRILLVFRNSETILWARLQVLSGFLVTAGGGIVAFAQDPNVTGMMHVIITDARQWAIYGIGLMGLGAVTEAVRRHRTVPDPVTGAIDTPPPEPKG